MAPPDSPECLETLNLIENSPEPESPQSDHRPETPQSGTSSHATRCVNTCTICTPPPDLRELCAFPRARAGAAALLQRRPRCFRLWTLFFVSLFRGYRENETIRRSSLYMSVFFLSKRIERERRIDQIFNISQIGPHGPCLVEYVKLLVQDVVTALVTAIVDSLKIRTDPAQRPVGAQRYWRVKYDIQNLNPRPDHMWLETEPDSNGCCIMDKLRSEGPIPFEEPKTVNAERYTVVALPSVVVKFGKDNRVLTSSCIMAILFLWSADVAPAPVTSHTVLTSFGEDTHARRDNTSAPQHV
ncbi:hypothetical protein EVAR_4393_1 [Eumeta japonica]|uniref:Uncharacterized protein n=1 Tax=Eumeta variegata TaxID=151549 RepID=A0A4C1T116_EUMVA|nr:hypothetical protein EVAR_4393_1 [Eumeta japonica]